MGCRGDSNTKKKTRTRTRSTIYLSSIRASPHHPLSLSGNPWSFGGLSVLFNIIEIRTVEMRTLLLITFLEGGHANAFALNYRFSRKISMYACTFYAKPQSQGKNRMETVLLNSRITIFAAAARFVTKQNKRKAARQWSSPPH